MKVVAAGDYQPMSYLVPDTEQYAGFDAELAEDIAKEIESGSVDELTGRDIFKFHK